MQQGSSPVLSYTPPDFAARLPNVPRARVRLASVPTRVHGLPRLRLPPEGPREVLVKRDDETGSLMSGNKVRKLEFLLAEALEKGFSSVVTVGGVQSNHARATAV
eukprot:RCo031508